MKTLLLPIVSLTIVILPANPISATPRRSEAMVSEPVSFSDLNMALSRDRQRLKDRIAFTAYRLCLVEGTASPSPLFADPVCYRAAMKDALAQMSTAVVRANGAAIASAEHTSVEPH